MNKHYFLFLLLALTCNFSLTAQTIYHVKTAAEGGSDTNDGSDWNNAFATVQKALQAAETTTAIDQIWVAAGTYQPTEIPYTTGTDNRLKTFALSQDVQLYGGFAGTETQLDQRNPAINPTILDANNGYHTLIAIDLSEDAIIDGFTIRGANGNGSFANTYAGGGFWHTNAGGLFLRSSDVQVRNCIFRNNRSDAGSGVMIQSASNPTITNCLFFKNTKGSAIYTFQGSKPKIINCTVTDNATGIFNRQSESQPAYINTIIYNNGTNVAITEGCVPTFKNCLVQGSGGSSNWSINNATDLGGNINANPSFVDADNNNFQLVNCSPALNVGDNNSNTETSDLAGEPRIFNNGIIDLGAYELQEAATNIVIRYVRTGATGNADGTNWADAYPNLQDALAAPLGSRCDEIITQIWVAAGTYYPDEGAGETNDNRDASFIMKNNLAIYGGFAGTETQLSQRNMTANETILSGDIDQDNALNGNSYTVVRNSGTNNTAILDGFTISRANANGTGLNWRVQGGGMYNLNASPRILNCQFKNNTARSKGGGTLNDNGQPIFINCVWTQNNTVGSGGAISGYGSTQQTFINCTIEGNSTPSGSGGLFNDQNSQATLTNCIIWNNRVEGEIGTAAANIANNSSANSFSATYSLLQGHNPTGMGNLDGTDASNNPQFVQETDFSDASVVADLRLKVCAPALNVGSNTANSEMTDAAGNPRIFNSETIDLGAYELQSAAANISVSAPTVVQPTCPSQEGSITINATNDVGTLEYSINGGATYQASNEFLNLKARSYNVQVRLQGTDCPKAYSENPITFNEICCLADGEIVYVKKDATGNNDGTSWENAFTELQPAINLACVGTPIWVAAGTYQPTEIPFDEHDNDERLKTFHLRKDIQLYGGFAGTETTLEERNSATNLTILDGNGGFHTLIATALTRAAVIDGFTIQGGNASGGVPTSTYAGADFTSFRGGGLLLNAASPTITNCIFKNNLASLGSAFTARFESDPLLINCLLANNTAKAGAGAPSVVEIQTDSSPRFVNCTITNNDNGIAHRAGTVATYINTIIFANNNNLAFFSNGAASIRNSLIEGSGGSNNWSLSDATDFGGNIDDNPKFVDSDNGDYSLRNDSPAFNFGNNDDNATTTDLAGNARIFSDVNGSIIDLGAYELQELGFTEIAVEGNGVDITNQDMTPSATDNTDFGENRIKVFTIKNIGSNVLTVGTDAVTISGAQATDFRVTRQPDASISINDSTIFIIKFDPTEIGLKNAVVSINNNDADEQPFTFSIQGTGTKANTNTEEVTIDGPFCNGCDDPQEGSAVGCDGGVNQIIQAIDVADLTADFLVNAVNFNQESFDSAPLVTVSIFCGDAETVPYTSVNTPIYSQVYQTKSADDGKCVNIPFDTPPLIDVDCGTRIWVEFRTTGARCVSTPANCSGTTATGKHTYIRAPDCNVNTPKTLKSEGFSVDAGFAINIANPLQIEGELIYCATDKTTTLNAGEGWTNYLWSNEATTAMIEVSAGTYSVTVTDVNGTMYSDEVTVVENEVPTATAMVTPSTCQIETHTAENDGKITISNFAASDKYQYSLGNTFDESKAIPATATTIPANGIIVNNLENANQAYTVRITNSKDCYVDKVVNLTKTNCGNTSAQAGANQLNLCGTIAQLAAIAPAIGTGEWTVMPAGGSFDDATKPNAQFYGKMGGNYTLTWTVLGANDQVQISFNGDADNDTVQDCIDLCPGGDDRINTDGMGMPDECDCDPNNSNDETVHLPGVIITKTDLDEGLYQSSLELFSTARINPNKVVEFKAGKQITLEQGFHAQAGTDFTASIEYCNFPNNPLVEEETAAFRNVLKEALAAQDAKITKADPLDLKTRQPSYSTTNIGLTVGPNPFKGSTTAYIDLPKATKASLVVFDAQGRLVKMVLHQAQMPAGKHALPIIDPQITTGTFYVHLRTDEENVVQKVIALR